METVTPTKIKDESTAGGVQVTVTYLDGQGNEQTASATNSAIVSIAEKIKEYWADDKSPTVSAEIDSGALNKLSYEFPAPTG